MEQLCETTTAIITFFSTLSADGREFTLMARIRQSSWRRAPKGAAPKGQAERILPTGYCCKILSGKPLRQQIPENWCELLLFQLGGSCREGGEKIEAGEIGAWWRVERGGWLIGILEAAGPVMDFPGGRSPVKVGARRKALAYVGRQAR